MKFSILSLVVLFTAAPAFAQDGSLSILCQTLDRHQPDPGVEYVPGVDVDGDPVVPADVNDAGRMAHLGAVYIPIEIDLIQRFGLNVPADMEIRPEVALVAVREDGRVEYNGQDISKQVFYTCHPSKAPNVQQPETAEPQVTITAPVAVPQGNGQPAPDTVNSDEIIEGEYKP